MDCTNMGLHCTELVDQRYSPLCNCSTFHRHIVDNVVKLKFFCRFRELEEHYSVFYEAC